MARSAGRAQAPAGYSPRPDWQLRLSTYGARRAAARALPRAPPSPRGRRHARAARPRWDGHPPGSGSALLRPRPLRTVRAGCPAHGSSKPRGRGGLKRRFPALAGLLPALAGCVHQAGLVIVGWAGPPVVGEIAGGYRLAGDLQPPPFPLLRRLGWLTSGE